MTDSNDDIRTKIKKSKTDSSPIPETVDELKNRPEALNLLNIYSYVTNSSLENTLSNMKGKEFSKFKNDLTDALISMICPIGKKISDLRQDTSYLSNILAEGTNKANSVAEKNLKEVKKIIGFYQVDTKV